MKQPELPTTLRIVLPCLIFLCFTSAGAQLPDSVRIGDLVYRSATSISYPKVASSRVVGDLTTTVTVRNVGTSAAVLDLRRCPATVRVNFGFDLRRRHWLQEPVPALSCMPAPGRLTVQPGESAAFVSTIRDWEHGSVLRFGEIRFATELHLADTLVAVASGVSKSSSDLSGLRYTATATVRSEAPDSLLVTITATNTLDVPIHFIYGECGVSALGFRSRDVSGRPSWDWGQRGMPKAFGMKNYGLACSLVGYDASIAPGHSMEFTTESPVYELLGDSLPDGRYHVVAIARISGRNPKPERLYAGSVVLSSNQKPLPRQRTIDRLQVNADANRVSFGDGTDSLDVSFTIRNLDAKTRHLSPDNNGACLPFVGYVTTARRNSHYMFRGADWYAKPCPLEFPEMTLAPGESRTLKGRVAAPQGEMRYVLWLSIFGGNILGEAGRIESSLGVNETSTLHRVANLWDAHTHLSLYGPDALDSLTAYGIVGVRDLGTNKLDEILRWRNEIVDGKRKGPRIYTAGVILDGPKEDSSNRWTIRTELEAEHAVDSLAKRGVDFIKTHNGLSPAVYFAVLRAAKAHHLKVASHLPRGITAWEAADSGAASIEHAAESILASPIYAGYAKTPAEAVAWWKSASGDSAIARLKKSGVYFTPTLALYACNVNLSSDPAVREQRGMLLKDLIELTGRIYRAGIPIMAGSDIGAQREDYRPGQSLYQEMTYLRRTGMNETDVIRAASTNIQAWLEH